MQIFLPHTEPKTNPIRRVLAALRFESTNLALASGLRSGEATSRQLLFFAEAYELDLRLTPVGEAWVISGQVLGGEEPHTIQRSPANARPAIGVALQRGTMALETVLNDQYEFTLPPVPVGIYKLTVHLPDLEVVVAALKVG